MKKPDFSIALLYLLRAFQARGGTPYLVGGAVRDMIMEVPQGDYDIEIHHLDPRLVQEVALQHGTLVEAGASFTVLKVRLKSGEVIDVSVPRRETHTGAGHKGFEYAADPHLGVREAARRRDFTMNAVYYDPFSDFFHDPFGGITDIRLSCLRMVDPSTFMDDPLRIMRGAQFNARFAMFIDTETRREIMANSHRLEELSPERFEREWRKLLFSDHPEWGFQYLTHTESLQDACPEIWTLFGIEQDPEYHPEIDALTHTLQTIEAARKLCTQYSLSEDLTWRIMLASMLHDVGKAETTKTYPDGRIRSLGHEDVGAQKAQNWCERTFIDTTTTNAVVHLVAEHMWAHNAFGTGTVSNAAFRRLADRLYPATIADLAILTQADEFGGKRYMEVRGDWGYARETEEASWLLKRAAQVGVTERRAETLIMGRDLIAQGLLPGPLFGKVIALVEQWRDVDEALTKDAVLGTLNWSADVLSQLTTIVGAFRVQGN